MKIKIDWRSTIAALAIFIGLAVFPFANTCESEDGTACTWRADTQGNNSGTSFTDYYGLVIPHD